MPYYLPQQTLGLGGLISAAMAFTSEQARQKQEAEQTAMQKQQLDQAAALAPLQMQEAQARIGESTANTDATTQRTRQDAIYAGPQKALTPKQSVEPSWNKKDPLGSAIARMTHYQHLATIYAQDQSDASQAAAAQAQAQAKTWGDLASKYLTEGGKDTRQNVGFQQRVALKGIPQARAPGVGRSGGSRGGGSADQDTIDGVETQISKSNDPRATAAHFVSRALASGANSKTVESIRALGDYYGRKYTDAHPKANNSLSQFFSAP